MFKDKLYAVLKNILSTINDINNTINDINNKVLTNISSISSINLWKAGIADYVIEQGTSTETMTSGGSITWTYRKWNSGIAECWADPSIVVTEWTLWNNLYQGYTSSQYFLYPSGLFKSEETPKLNITCYPPTTGGYGTAGVEIWTDSSNQHTNVRTPLIYPLRPQSSTAPTAGGILIMSMSAKGKWK